MSIVSKFTASIASLIVGIAGLLVLAFGSAALVGDTDWNFMADTDWNSVHVSTKAVTDCDWNSPC
jgi:hypothetical protein